MANLYLNGFEWGTAREFSQFFGVGDDEIRSYSELGYYNTPSQARSGNYCFELGGYRTGIYVVYPSREEVYIQFAIKSNNYTSFFGEDQVFWWNCTNGSNTLKTIGQLGITYAGQIYLYVWNPIYDFGDYTSPLLLVGGGNIRLQGEVWYVIEVRIKSHNTTGTIEVRVDGITDISFSGCTAPSGYNNSTRCGWYAFWMYFLDDIVINDTTGSFNNSWPNQMKIVLLKPNSQGDYSEWDKEGGILGYDLVNNVPSDPSTYVYSTTSSQREMYQLENLPDEAETVSVVRGSAWANRSSKNLSQLIFEAKTGGSIYSSSGQNLYLAPHHTSYAWDYNPNTGVAWTVNDVNLMQGGIKSSV